MENKQQIYDELTAQLDALMEGESEEMSVLANVSAALAERFPWFWTGFYLEREGELRLGPFQGTVACMHIAHGRGVCGTAFERRQSIVVPDVEQFPGHIACSSLSRSEIVVPIFNGKGEPVGVLDIDSTSLTAFDDVDRQNLERICQLLTRHLYH
jgi:GAF domain-containing protein